jgi:hypothetical protein
VDAHVCVRVCARACVFVRVHTVGEGEGECAKINK